MTVIQKRSRGEMVKLIQDRMVREIGSARSTERIEQDLIVMEAVGLISFPPETKDNTLPEHDPNVIHAAAMHLAEGSWGWQIDGSAAVALLYSLVKAGFRISRDKIASEDDLERASVRGLAAQFRKMGFEIVKTG